MKEPTLRKRRSKDIPEGQPRPHPRVMHTHQKKTGRKLTRFVYPHEVCNVRSKSDLKKNLEHYSHPAPMLDGSPLAKNQFAMRYLIEWVFPALRWFCKVYGVEQPGWLEGKGWAEDLDEEEYKRIFGDKPLRLTEWKEDASLAGNRA